MHGARQVQRRRLRDLDGLLHGGQQAVAPLPPQGRPETLRPADEQLDDHAGVLLHALAWNTKIVCSAGVPSVLYTPLDGKQVRERANVPGHTVDKDSEAQEGEVALPFDGVPADIGVAFSQQHGAALEAAACQVGDHLQVHTASKSLIHL